MSNFGRSGLTLFRFVDVTSVHCFEKKFYESGAFSSRFLSWFLFVHGVW